MIKQIREETKHSFLYNHHPFPSLRILGNRLKLPFIHRSQRLFATKYTITLYESPLAAIFPRSFTLLPWKWSQNARGSRTVLFAEWKINRGVLDRYLMIKPRFHGPEKHFYLLVGFTSWRTRNILSNVSPSFQVGRRFHHFNISLSTDNAICQIDHCRMLLITPLSVICNIIRAVMYVQFL